MESIKDQDEWVAIRSFESWHVEGWVGRDYIVNYGTNSLLIDLLMILTNILVKDHRDHEDEASFSYDSDRSNEKSN